MSQLKGLEYLDHTVQQPPPCAQSSTFILLFFCVSTFDFFPSLFRLPFWALKLHIQFGHCCSVVGEAPVSTLCWKLPNRFARQSVHHKESFSGGIYFSCYIWPMLVWYFDEMIINTEHWWLWGSVGTEYEYVCFELGRRRSLKTAVPQRRVILGLGKRHAIVGVRIDLYLPECYQLWQKVGVRAEG